MERFSEESPREINAMASAMEQVAALPHDPVFLEFIHKNRTITEVHYEQATTQAPFCIDTTLLHTISEEDLNGNTIITISRLQLESLTDSHSTSIAGVGEIDQVEYVISYNSDNETVKLHERLYPDLPAPIELTPQQFTEFILSGIVANHSSAIELEDVLNAFDSSPDEADRLPTLLYALGSINGRSSRTTTALIDTGGEVMGARLTERESPSDNTEEDTLSLYSPSELTTDTSHLVNEHRIDPFDRRRKEISEYVLRGVSPTDINSASLEYLMSGTTLQAQQLDRYESSGDSSSAREYARACIEFLAAYRRAR